MKLSSWSQDPSWTATYNIESQLALKAGSSLLKLTFKVTGPISDLALPLETPQSRGQLNQALWEHSCFELFASVHGSQNYVEWNLSSSGEFGHFHFSGYRENIKLAEPIASGVGEISFQKFPSHLELSTHIDLEKVPALFLALSDENMSLDFSVTAILENKRGEKGYWALAHMGTKPDFHLRDSFVLSFP